MSARKAGRKPVTEFRTLEGRPKPGQAPTQVIADLLVGGLASNTVATLEWSRFFSNDLDLTACHDAVVDAAERANRGDLGDAEAVLVAQAVTLNAVFTNLVHRSRSSEYVDQLDRYMRLALKAQAQCRATLETLAAMKNPPTVFARQANIAHGPQQVNNGAPLARAGESKSVPNRVLEANGERLEPTAAGTTGAGDSTMATVGALHGAPHG